MSHSLFCYLNFYKKVLKNPVIFNIKINNFNPQININLRVKTYSKTMPTRNYSHRKRQQKSQIITIAGLVTAAVALVLILAKLIFSGVTTLASDGSLDLSNTNSYDVSETAMVSTSDAVRIILLMLISLKHLVIRTLILLMTLKVVLNKPLIR